jgi:hypothetical protein
MNHMNKAVDLSKTADLRRSGSKKGANTIKEEMDLAQTSDQDPDRGGGVESSPDAQLSTLIQPEKKCDKGAFREDELADKMGIARNTLRTIRKKHLTKDDDWIMDGNAVLLLPTAIEKLLRQLSLDQNDIPKKTPPHLLQVKKYWANKRMLGCVDPSGEDSIIQVVWVKDSAMFKPNQIIPVKWQKSRLILACRQPTTKGILK